VAAERARQIGCVIVADADAKARTAAAGLLRRVGFDVREVGTGTEALEVARSVRPVAVLLDVALPEISGYQVCHILRGEYGAGLPILLLSAGRLKSHDRAAGLLLGADEYLSKPFLPDELLARIKSHRPASRAQATNGNGEQSVAAKLTPSELRVLRLLAGGAHTKSIATELSIAPKTVSMHIQNAMGKLGVHTRTQAVVLAHQLGLVEDRRSSNSDVQAHVVSITRRTASAAAADR
jgi:two-component system nitrate/nitrite response regulator NarL